MDRRGFLRNAVGGAGALSLLPASMVRALAAPPPPGGLNNVEHVVILMQENRSFDHYFGTMRGVRGFADLNAAQLPTGRSVFHQPGGEGYVLPFPTTLQNLNGLDHSLGGGNQAWHLGWYDQWCAAKSPTTMAYYPPEELEFYHQLAGAFTTCDHYHCSVAGATLPNRRHLMTGKVDNPAAYENVETVMRDLILGDDAGLRFALTFGDQAVADGVAALLRGVASPLVVSVLGPLVKSAVGFDLSSPVYRKLADDPNLPANLLEALQGFRWTTYPERLESRGVSWRVYQEWDNYSDNVLDYFAPFVRIMEKVLRNTGTGVAPLPYRTLEYFYRDVRAKPADRPRLLKLLDEGLKTLTPAELRLFERGLYRAEAGGLLREFRRDVENGTLPTVSWLVLPEQQTEHPVWGPAYGAKAVHDLLDAVCSDPETWNKTAFLINYDENDGFFDHVLPPTAPPGSGGDNALGIPVGLGARVPMTVVSPWSKGGVCSEVFDHTSVLRFLELVTGVDEPNISAWRRSITGDLTTALDFTTSTAPSLPPVPEPAEQPGTGKNQPMPSPQTAPVQQPGTTVKRPLPYAPLVNLRQDAAHGQVVVTMDHGGAPGSTSIQYSLHPNAFRDFTTTEAAPARYDVAPGQPVTENVDATRDGAAGKYDLTCYAPNGFQARFAGDLTQAGATIEVTAATSPLGGRPLTLTMANTGRKPVVFTVKANAYRAGGPWTFAVAPAATATAPFPTAAPQEGSGWYDLAITADIDAGFLRRFRGYIETGRPGVTSDDAAPFSRLQPDRSLYEWGRGFVMAYDTATAVSEHQLAVYADSDAAALFRVPSEPPKLTIPLPPGSARGTVDVPAGKAPLPSGSYTAYHLTADGRPLAPPARVRVTPRLTTEKTVYRPQDRVSAAYTTDQPSGWNWIGLYADRGTGPDYHDYLEYQWADGAAGTREFILKDQAPGTTLFVCLLAANGYVPLSEPARFRIVSASTVDGQRS